MSKIFELFGYSLTDKSVQAEQGRRSAWCPFMGLPCDGGGNRPQSNLDLHQHPELAAYFQDAGLTTVPSGVCSLQLQLNQAPWIVCPRRLLFLSKNNQDQLAERGYQQFAESLLLKHSDYDPGTSVGVWSEVKLKYSIEQRSFDYTFDYILMPLKNVPIAELQQETGLSLHRLRSNLEAAGYALIQTDGQYLIQNFPVGVPVIVEVMTSSTSGGNKRKRTTIPMAFEDALLNKDHTAPGINYRQVWARMVSQLIVKSEVGLAWGGKTIWILQDRLVDYISKSTALNVYQFSADTTSEVNILAFAYGKDFEPVNGIIELKLGSLYAGPIQSEATKHAPSFQDMIRIGITPPRSTLVRLLITRKPSLILQT